MSGSDMCGVCDYCKGEPLAKECEHRPACEDAYARAEGELARARELLEAAHRLQGPP